MRSSDLASLKLSPGKLFNTTVEEWFELRNSLHVAEMIALAALNRKESRGAHQRLDHPETKTDFERNQILHLDGDSIGSRWIPVGDAAASASLQPR
jgi:succinate dehydrogenase/fumarate reductase flavoprotein subunit